jgi:hypothetical protein
MLARCSRCDATTEDASQVGRLLAWGTLPSGECLCANCNATLSEYTIQCSHEGCDRSFVFQNREPIYEATFAAFVLDHVMREKAWGTDAKGRPLCHEHAPRRRMVYLTETIRSINPYEVAFDRGAIKLSMIPPEARASLYGMIGRQVGIVITLAETRYAHIRMADPDDTGATNYVAALPCCDCPTVLALPGTAPDVATAEAELMAFATSLKWQAQRDAVNATIITGVCPVCLDVE